MKKILVICMIVSMLLCACDSEGTTTTQVVEIVMEKDNDYYETENWTLDTLVEEFERIGFTNIETVSLYEGDNSDYKYGQISSVRIDDEMLGWDKGKIYDSFRLRKSRKNAI